MLSTQTTPYIVVSVLIHGKIGAVPTPKQWMGRNHVVRYLKGTPHIGILIPNRTPNLGQTAWSNAH